MIPRFISFYICSVLLFSACGIARKSVTVSPPNNDALESGVASWYGPNFHGKLTANGETYDMNGITAAHRTLPFGTILLVENLDNKKTVKVRVNDRGPYAKDRIIDLSKGAAKEIDMMGPGTANVRLYLIEGDLKNSRIKDLTTPHYTVQLASFKKEDQAVAFSTKIKGSRVEALEINGEKVFRVYYGTFTDPEKAKKNQQRLQRQGRSGFVKQIENN